MSEPGTGRPPNTDPRMFINQDNFPSERMRTCSAFWVNEELVSSLSVVFWHITWSLVSFSLITTLEDLRSFLEELLHQPSALWAWMFFAVLEHVKSLQTRRRPLIFMFQCRKVWQKREPWTPHQEELCYIRLRGTGTRTSTLKTQSTQTLPADAQATWSHDHMIARSHDHMITAATLNWTLVVFKGWVGQSGPWFISICSDREEYVTESFYTEDAFLIVQ